MHRSRTAVVRLASALWLLLAIAALLPHASLAAKPTLEQRVARLTDLTRQGGGVAHLDPTTYDEFVARPRNYSFVVLLTALESPHLKCPPCSLLDPEFQMLAYSWQRNGNPVNRLFFGQIDFHTGKEIFQRLSLNTVPAMYYFPPTDGPYAAKFSESTRYDFQTLGFEAEMIAQYLSQQLGVPIPIVRPPDYWSLISYGFMVLGCLAALKLFMRPIQGILRSRRTWMATTLVFVLLMCSGQMWNHIRGPPYVMPTQKGVRFIAPGSQSQYGLESQLVAVLYAILAFSVMSLLQSTPAIDNQHKQRLSIYFWLGVMVFVFSVYFVLFRTKQPSYPFRMFL